MEGVFCALVQVLQPFCVLGATKLLGDAQRWRELTGRYPMGRLAEPDEIAELAVFCSSPLCSYLSGSVINVEGGQMYATSAK